PRQPLNLSPTQTGKRPDCPKRQHFRIGRLEKPHYFGDGKNFNLRLALFCALNVRNRIFSHITAPFGKTEKHRQPATKRVARDCADAKSSQPFVNLARVDFGDHFLAKRIDEATKPHAQVTKISS